MESDGQYLAHHRDISVSLIQFLKLVISLLPEAGYTSLHFVMVSSMFLVANWSAARRILKICPNGYHCSRKLPNLASPIGSTLATITRSNAL